MRRISPGRAARESFVHGAGLSRVSVRDLLLPSTDRTVAVQWLVVVVITVVLVIAVRRERALVLLVLGMSSCVIGFFGLRMIH